MIICPWLRNSPQNFTVALETSYLAPSCVYNPFSAVCKLSYDGILIQLVLVKVHKLIGSLQTSSEVFEKSENVGKFSKRSSNTFFKIFENFRKSSECSEMLEKLDSIIDSNRL